MKRPLHSRRSFVQIAALGVCALWPGPAGRGLLAATSPTGDAADLLAAAAAGNLAAVERILDRSPELVRVVDERGRSAFALAHLGGHRAVGDHLVARGFRADVHEAALAGDWQRFQELTAENPAVVNREHPIGGNAMHAAAVGGAGPDLWRIYAATGDPNFMSSGTTPLQAALRFRDLETAEVTAATLLANAANPKPRGTTEAPPLVIAAERGSKELVEMLIRLGADPRARDPRGRTAHQAAAASGDAEVIALLERQAEIPRSRPSSRVAFDAQGKPYRPPEITDIPLVERRQFVGRSHGDLEFVRQAVAREPRLVHSAATTSEISVEACAHTGRREIVDFLLEHGAPYSIPTAVMRDDRSRVVDLLDQDPGRIHERGAHDFPLLWYPVIGSGGIEMSRLLLARGAELERQHYLGTTALHWACMRGPIDLVAFLIENGADVNRPGRKFNPAGETPLDCARRRDQEAIARLLIDRGART